jgi:pilus assembly protein CpaB
MKPKTLILMVVAVACGLGASYMTSKLLAERAKPLDVPKVPVLVAKVRVPAWQTIKEPEKFFEVKEYPQDLAPRKSLGDLAEVKDQRLKVFLEENKPLTQDELVSKDQADLAAQILPGQRATAIKVNAESLAGGFILPGTRVDVVHTTRGNDSSSKMILQNMLVLAIDTIDTKDPEKRNHIGSTVTLAASPEEALRLSLAGAIGDLRLFLKGHGDMQRIRPLVVRANDLDKPVRDSSDAEKPEAPAAAPTTVVTTPELPPVVEKKDEVVAAPAPAAPAPAPEKKVEEVKVKPIKRHTMTINNGTSREKAVFLLGEKSEDDDDATPSRTEETPGKRPEPPKAAPIPPAPLPAPGPIGPTGRSRGGRTRN